MRRGRLSSKGNRITRERGCGCIDAKENLSFVWGSARDFRSTKMGRCRKRGAMEVEPRGVGFMSARGPGERTNGQAPVINLRKTGGRTEKWSPFGKSA